MRIFPSRRIDHVVLAVRDLGAAETFYRRLGFQVGARNIHPWGTENCLIQFDNSFIELITVSAGVSEFPRHGLRLFSFGAFVRDYLDQREGIAMLVLDSDDAAADANRFEKAGIGTFEPFFFERAGRRPDGTETNVAFTLAFAVNTNAPLAGFFVCQQHFPEHFWEPSLQCHPNGIRAIACAEMTTPDPSIHAAFLSAFTEASAHSEESGLSFPLRNGCLRVVPDLGIEPFLTHRSMTFDVPDLAAHAARLRAEGFAFEPIKGGVRVPAASAFGAELRFERQMIDGTRKGFKPI